MPEHTIQQSLSQQQTLAPQMRRSLEILQAGTMELNQMVQQALETNPVLEDIGESDSLDAIEHEDLDDLSSLNETDDDWREESILSGTTRNWTEDNEAAREHLYNSIVAPQTLQQHLLDQLAVAAAAEPVRLATEALIGALDERGFFDQAPDQVGRQFAINPPDLEAALRLLHSFEPPGIGATDLRHSLLLQLERAGQVGSVEYRIVCQFLDDLARRRYPPIARQLGTTVERIVEAAERIGRLNANPGGDFNPTGNPEVRPDVVIEEDRDGEFIARLTNDYLPRLKISDYYKDLVAKTGSDREARSYLREHLREGRTLMRSLSLRQETIQTIAERIVAHQGPFLRQGHRHLRPLTMNGIAEELGLHATTVSRAVAGKFVLTPHGMMEMRAFFASGYQTAGGEEISNAGVRDALQQLVESENPAKPMSDSALTKALAEEGIKVARRTVAKYREQLGILPSHLRKTFTG